MDRFCKDLLALYEELDGQSVGCTDRRETHLLWDVGLHELGHVFVLAPVQPRKLTAPDLSHLLFEASTELTRHTQVLQHALHRFCSPELQADGHHASDNGTTDGSAVADSPGEPGRYSGDGWILRLQPEFLAHGQENGL